VDPLGDPVQRRRPAAAVAVRRQVDRDAGDGIVQPVDDRPPYAPVEGQSVQEDDRRAGPLEVVGQTGLQVSRGCHDAPPEQVPLADGGLIQEA
jgi:hypothetical protein